MAALGGRSWWPLLADAVENVICGPNKLQASVRSGTPGPRGPGSRPQNGLTNRNTPLAQMGLSMVDTSALARGGDSTGRVLGKYRDVVVMSGDQPKYLDLSQSHR